MLVIKEKIWAECFKKETSHSIPHNIYVVPRKIRTIKQCFKFLNIMVEEISAMGDAIMAGTDIVTFPSVLNMSYESFKFERLSKIINKIHRKIDDIMMVYLTFITNNFICFPNGAFKLEKLVDKIEYVWEFTALDINQYEKIKDPTHPSINEWKILFQGSIDAFNHCIKVWNIKFKTNIKFAKLVNSVDDQEV